MIQNSTVNFRRFPDGAAAVQQLMNLESALRNMISYLRKLEMVFALVSAMTFRENEHKFSQISRTSILKYQTIDILIMNASTRSILKGPLD